MSQSYTTTSTSTPINSYTTTYTTTASPSYTYTTVSPGWCSNIDGNITINGDVYVKGNIKKEKKKNKGDKKMLNLEFGTIQARLSTYGIAIRNNNGRWFSYNKQTDELIDVTELSFDSKNMLYKIPVAIKEIKTGDVILHNGRMMFVTVPAGEGFKTLSAINPLDGTVIEIVPAKNLFNFNYITKVVSLLDTGAFGAPSEDNPFGNMLPLLMCGEDRDFDPMMLMLMNKDQKIDQNMLLMMALQDEMEDNKWLPFMMMMNLQNKGD